MPRHIVRAGQSFSSADMAAEDYPFSIVAFSRENRLARVVWCVTVLRPEPGAKALLKVPPLKHWNGGRHIDIAVLPAERAATLLRRHGPL
jgi:hypothetical protein